jgi:signal transduction histidine kinase
VAHETKKDGELSGASVGIGGIAEERWVWQTRDRMHCGSKLRSYALVFAGWTAAGLAFGTQYYFASSAWGPQIPWTRTVLFGLRDWYLWALLSIAIWKLVDRYPLERRLFWQHLWIYLGACAASVMIIQGVGWVFSEVLFPGTFGFHGANDSPGAPPPPLGGGEMFRRILLSIFSFKAVFDATVFWLLVTARYALNSTRRLQERYLIEAELKSSLTEARLRALKMQLQPHFLFNTLNAIAALIRKNPKTAETMIGSLSELLRATLDLADRQEVPLSEELEFVNCYLSIEQLRFGDRLTVRATIDPNAADALVPPMILQPIVENAIRHGIEPNIGTSTLAIAARIQNDNILLTVQDNGPGFAAKKQEGIGLQNTRARLHQLYGGHEHLRCETAEGGGAKVTLTLPLRREPAGLISSQQLP